MIPLRAAVEQKLAAEHSSRTDLDSPDFYCRETALVFPDGQVPPPPYWDKTKGVYIMLLDKKYLRRELPFFNYYVQTKVKRATFEVDEFNDDLPDQMLAMLAVLVDSHPWIADARRARNTGDAGQSEPSSPTEPDGEELDASASEDDAESSAGPAPGAHAQLQAAHAGLREELKKSEARSAQLTVELRTSKESNAELVSCKAELESREGAMQVELKSCNAELEWYKAELEACKAELESRTAGMQSRDAELKSCCAEITEMDSHIAELKAELVSCKPKLELRNVVPVAKSAAQAETPASKVRKPLVPRDLNTASPRQATCGGRDSCRNTCNLSRCSVPEADGGCSTGGSCNSGLGSGGSSKGGRASFDSAPSSCSSSSSWLPKYVSPSATARNACAAAMKEGLKR